MPQQEPSNESNAAESNEPAEATLPAPSEDESDGAFSFAPGTEPIFDGNGFADNALTTGGKFASYSETDRDKSG
jgi:hypothetical protein